MVSFLRVMLIITLRISQRFRSGEKERVGRKENPCPKGLGYSWFLQLAVSKK